MLRSVALPAILCALGVVPLTAQPVISAKSGVVAYVEGAVFLGDQQVEYSITKFPEMKENSVLRTQEGRAELLLTPGVLLRLGENSSLKLLSNRLIDTRLVLQTGSAVVEADAISKDNNVTIVCQDGTVALSKAGIYRFDAAPGSVRVFKGEASVQTPDGTVMVSGGRMAMLSGSSATVQKFNVEETDALDHWSHRRGEYVALANVSAAKTLMDQGGYAAYAPYLGVGLGGLGYGSGYGYGGLNGCMNAWAFNQFYGMYTYMPCNGYLYSPYGYAFWSPYTVNRAFYMMSGGGYGYYGNGGTRGVTRTTAGASGLSGYRSAGRGGIAASGVSARGSAGGAAYGGGRGSAGGFSGGGGGFSGGGFSGGGAAGGGGGGGVGGGGGHGGGGGGHGGR